MVIRRHLVAIFGAAAVLLAAAGAGAAEIDYGAVIDVAGRQRMLTQRMIKAYCQVGLAVTPEVSRDQLGRAASRFAEELARLKRGAPNAAVRQAAQRVEKLWLPFHEAVVGPVARDKANRLDTQGESLLKASHELVMALQEAAGTRHARLVNIAGRQRMLSQRLAKYYMLRVWGLDTPAMREEMEAAANEFSGALGTLQSAAENTPAIARELDAVALQWEWFRRALELQGAESYAFVVADASEAILNSMDLVTARYAALGHK